MKTFQCYSIILFIFSGKNKLEESNILLPFNTKFINQIQKYPHIIEFYACILYIFFSLLGFTPRKIEQPLRGMELQQKEEKKD